MMLLSLVMRQLFSSHRVSCCRAHGWHCTKNVNEHVSFDGNGDEVGKASLVCSIVQDNALLFLPNSSG